MSDTSPSLNPVEDDADLQRDVASLRQAVEQSQKRSHRFWVLTTMWLIAAAMVVTFLLRTARQVENAKLETKAAVDRANAQAAEAVNIVATMRKQLTDQEAESQARLQHAEAVNKALLARQAETDQIVGNMRRQLEETLNRMLREEDRLNQLTLGKPTWAHEFD